MKKRNTDGTKGSSIIGYFLAGEFRYVDDTDRSDIGRWKVKDKNLTYKTSVIIDILIESCNQLINIYELIKNEAIHNL